MTEFLHQVVKKREREQENRSLMPSGFADEMRRQLQESYNRMTMQASGATYATDPWRITDSLTTIHGTIAVRTRSASAVDAYIRANIERHDYNLSRETTQHLHESGDMQWVLEEVSSARFTQMGRPQFTYSCSLCSQRVMCSESVPREAVLSGITVQ